MNDSLNIKILPFRAEDQDQVKNLILAGLGEHWGFIDPTKNPDLNDISSSYANATFLVAWCESRIAGTGALVPSSEGVGRIVRMSVAADMRRRGIGKLLLHRLCERARSAGYRRVILGTEAAWREVIEFYKACGFHVTHLDDSDACMALDLV